MKGWLPRGYKVSDGITVSKKLSGSGSWKIYQTSADGLVVICDALFQKWLGFRWAMPTIAKNNF